jgi:hypothetical protein
MDASSDRRREEERGLPDRQGVKSVETVPTPCRSRVQAFRDEIIRTIPKVPNTRQAIANQYAQPTRRLILALLT